MYRPIVWRTVSYKIVELERSLTSTEVENRMISQWEGGFFFFFFYEEKKKKDKSTDYAARL